MKDQTLKIKLNLKFPKHFNLLSLKIYLQSKYKKVKDYSMKILRSGCSKITKEKLRWSYNMMKNLYSQEKKYKLLRKESIKMFN